MAIGHYLVGILGRIGLAIGPCANPVAVQTLVKRLRPVKVDRALIRVGGEGDGGYLVVDDLEGIGACFSPGVSQTSTFEEDIAARGIPCFLADASVDFPPMKNDSFYFTKKFLGVVNDDSTMTMDSWVDSMAPSTGDLLLQMDIDGAEWEVILNISQNTLRRFRIIVLEVHSIWQMIGRFGFQIMGTAFDKILRDFEVVHIHPNNVAAAVEVAGVPVPSVLEITFLRKDRANILGPATVFPHELDRKNVASRPDLPLPKQWYD